MHSIVKRVQHRVNKLIAFAQLQPEIAGQLLGRVEFLRGFKELPKQAGMATEMRNGNGKYQP